MKAATVKKPFKKRQPEEADTQDLPRSNFMLPSREEVDNDNENKIKKCLKRLLTRTMSWKINQVRMMMMMMWTTIRLNGSCVSHVRYEKK
jgi:hypothetical protein